MNNNDTIKPQYRLKLYITGASPNSIKAVNNVRKICDEYLAGRYTLEVIDIYLKPELTSLDQVVAVPLLIKLDPLPVKRLIGNMSNKAQVLRGLHLAAEI